MALSQLQCLDENHVNPRTHESKPEFLYCEDQRLALEALLRDGREAFFKYLEARGLRGFLSDPELETLTGTVEPFDPDTEVVPENAEEDEPPLSLHYWPDLSDTSVPQMDLGWPDSEAYRGVTRATIHSQPPLDGQAHIKEIVRRTIAQAQKVIAVVMDVFTDVDIFRDLLDAGYRRRVSVYILLERTTIPHFLSMCQRANMHAGHLKHLRVRHTEGLEFYTRSSAKVRGRMGHRFMLIDGDKAVSGSYSFTWMSSRMDRNVITVVTGQAVDTFDRLFHTLYVTSRLVDLRQVATEPEPEPEPLPQPVVVPPPSAALARKLYNPKYALALGNPSFSPSPTPSAIHNSPKNAESQENTDVPDTKKRKHKRASKAAIQEGPPIHPGLINLEKAYLIPYLPTWPEPDPPSDVIGFINIRDPSKSIQVHLQRSEMFEISQAIRFSSPINMPVETLPEVARPRNVTTQHEETNKLLPAQYKTKVEGLVVDRVQPTQLKTQPGDIRSKAQGPVQNSPASQPRCESNRGTARTLSAHNRLHSHLDLDAGRCTTPFRNAPALLHSSNKASTLNTGSPSHTTQAVSTKNPELNPKEETGLNTETGVMSGTHTSHRSDLNTGQQIKTVLPGTDSHTKPQNISEVNHNIQIPIVKSDLFPASTSPMCSQSAFCENNHVSIITNVTTTVPLSSINPTPTSSSTLSPPVPSSPPSLPLTTPPIAKPRTIQLVIKDGIASDGQKHIQFSVIRGHETSTQTLVACNEPVVKEKMPDKEHETVSELQSNNGSKKGAQKDADNRGNIGDAPQVKQSETSQEAKNEEAIGSKDDRTGMHLLSGTNPGTLSDFLLTDAPEAESVNGQKIIPKDVEPTILSTDSKLTPHIAGIAKLQTWTNDTERDLTGCEFAEVPNEKNLAQHKTYLPSDPHRMSCCAMRSNDMNVLETSKAPTHIPLPATHKPNMSKDVLGHTSPTDTHGQQSNLVNRTDSLPNTAKHNTHTTIQEQTPKARLSTHTPEKPLCLHIFDTHVPDIRSVTPERELIVCTPTPAGFLPHLPTPDSQIRTPEPLSYTPDLRTPTSDVSDGYISPKTDSTPSTTSGEYYECNDSPFTESVVFQAAFHSHLMTEDHVSSNTPNAVTTPTSPTYINHASISSSHEKKLKIGEEDKSDNEESGSDVEEKEKKVAERRAGQEPWGPQRRGSDEAKTTADNPKQNKHLTDSGDKNKETQAQDPKRKRMLDQPAADRSVDGRATPDELTNQEAEAKQLSTGVLKPSEAPAEGEGLDKEKASGPSALESRDRCLSSTENEGQKLLHTPLRSLQGNQDGGVSPPSRPPRPSRPLSGVRPHGSRQQNQAESKALHGSSQALDKISSSCRVPIKPPPPVTEGAVGSAAGRRHAEASNSQQSHQPRPHPAAQSRMKTGQSTYQRPDPKAQTSSLHSHSSVLPQLHPHVNNQLGSAQVVHCQEDGNTPISFSFSKQHSLKALKDKMSKLPVRTKRDSSSSPVQRHKSDS